MKKGEKAEFNLAWWKGSQPKDAKKQPALQSAGKLELALKVYENAMARLERDGDDDARKNASSALDNVEACAKAAIAEASKDKKNPDMEATAQSLGRMDFAGERRRADALVEDEASGLADPKLFMPKLRRGLQKLARRSEDESLEPEKRGMNFGFVPGKAAIEHRLMLHPAKPGRALATRAAVDLGVEQRLVTFGFASVDPDKPERIRLHLEGKKLTGLAKKVRLMLKAFRSPQLKTAILYEGGVEVADELDPADEEDVAELGEDTRPEAAPAAAAAAAAQAPDFAALKGELAAMVEQIKALPGGVGAQQALVPLVAASTGALRAQDAELVETRLAELRAAIAAALARGDGAGAPPGNGGAAAAPAQGGAAPAGVVAYAKSRLAWQATVKRIAADIAKLRAALQAEYQGEEDGPAICAAFDTRVAPVLTTFDEALADKLDDATNAADPAARQALVEEARREIDRYRAFLESDTLIADLDDNPFVKLSIRTTVGGTLTALAAAVH